MTPFPVGPSRIGKDRHGAVAQRQRIPFATGRSRVRIPPAPPDGSSRGAPDKAPVRTDSHHALEKAMGGTVTPRWPSGSARGWGPRGRGFESRHSDARKPSKTKPARMRAKYAAWLERDGRLSRLAAERRRRRLGGEHEGPGRFHDRPGPSCLRTAYGFAAQAVGAPPSRERMHDPAPSRGLRPGPWATPPLSGKPEVPAAAVRGPAMRRGGRMRMPDTKGAHHVRSGRT